MKPLRAAIGNTELLENYGYEPVTDPISGHCCSLEERWHIISENWTALRSPELASLRQCMLRVHKECYPDDPRWRE